MMKSERTGITVGAVLTGLLLLAMHGGLIGIAESGGLPSPETGAVEARWRLPDPHDVGLGGELGDAYRRGVARLAQDPYRSLPFLRADLTFEMKRYFINYSGDISGRFIEAASLTSPRGKPTPAILGDLLTEVADYQKPDGHFGRDIEWNTPLDRKDAVPGRSTRTPTLWGNARLLVGLIEAHRAFGQPKLLEAARRLGDFYVATADRLLEPAREAEYRSTGSGPAGYVTDYFPALEGLVRLYRTTHDGRYLRVAERMAEFFPRFDKLPLDHSHGNLVAYHGLVLLNETTGKREYLNQALRRWKEAIEGGYIWPTGGVGEGFWVHWNRDEGCSEADWLRLNLDLWRATGETRFLDSIERLLVNHLALNRTPNGGYGHHEFLCDNDGPLMMKPKSFEAVFCCTFHGIMAMDTLKGHVVAGGPRGIFINFPVDVAAPVQAGGDLWNVSVRREDDTADAITCRLTIEPRGAVGKPPSVFLRRPGWAESVRVVDAQGRPVDAPCEEGYVALPIGAGAEGQVSVRFALARHVENRRLQPIDLSAKGIVRHRGVVLTHGPWLLLANVAQPRPVLVIGVDAQGRLKLPKAQDGCYRLGTVGTIDASEEEVRRAVSAPGATVELRRCEKSDRKHNAAFVFDLVTVED